jgi:hypothetical protein
MEKGCTCQSAGFGNAPDPPCPYHSRPHYYSYAMGEYGRIHFLIEMPSGWLVGIPEHAMKEQMELQEPNPEQDKPYHTHTLVRPEETREPPDEPSAAADALSRFMPMHAKPATPDELDELEGKIKHITHWMVEWGQRHDTSTGNFWDGIRELREAVARLETLVPGEGELVDHGSRIQKHDERLTQLEQRVDEICAALKDLAKRGGGKPVELMRFK